VVDAKGKIVAARPFERESGFSTNRRRKWGCRLNPAWSSPACATTHTRLHRKFLEPLPHPGMPGHNPMLCSCSKGRGHRPSL